MFVCRLWWTWLEKTSTQNSSKTSQRIGDRKHEINKCFITRPAYISIELNAHNLLYLVLLVKQNHLPKQTIINIHLFNSQRCESLFRDTRSLSSTFSTNINFTVKTFIGRAQKLSILNQMKHDHSRNDLSFPIHHKHQHVHSMPSIDQLNEIDTLDVQQSILNAYDRAVDIVEHSGILDTLSQYNIHNLYDLSEFVFDTLKKNSRLINYFSPTENDTVEEFGLEEENDDSDVEYYPHDQLYDESVFNFQKDVISDDEEDTINSKNLNFDGIRIVDKINPNLRRSYFKIKIKENIKYLHKQSACWLLLNNTTKLSNDRLSRVMLPTTNNNL